MPVPENFKRVVLAGGGGGEAVTVTVGPGSYVVDAGPATVLVIVVGCELLLPIAIPIPRLALVATKYVATFKDVFTFLLLVTGSSCFLTFKVLLGTWIVSHDVPSRRNCGLRAGRSG